MISFQFQHYEHLGMWEIAHFLMMYKRAGPKLIFFFFFYKELAVAKF